MSGGETGSEKTGALHRHSYSVACQRCDDAGGIADQKDPAGGLFLRSKYHVSRPEYRYGCQNFFKAGTEQSREMPVHAG